MRSFLGDHFLKRFAGALKRRLDVPVSKIEEIKVEADKAFAIDEYYAADKDRDHAIVDGEDKSDGIGQEK